MRIKNIVIPVAAATMLVFGSYGCGSEPEAEQTVEQTDDMESETDAEDTADTDESDTAGDTAEQSAEEDAADEDTTAADDTGDTASTDESTAAESTTTGDESTADKSTTDESGVTVNSTHDDVQLGDDEYKGNNELDGAYESLSDEEKAEVDQIVEELLEEHPEWLENNGGDIPYTGPAQGTPSTGELDDPDYQFGQGDYSNIPDGLTVY